MKFPKVKFFSNNNTYGVTEWWFILLKHILPNFWSIHWAQGKTYLPCCIEHLTISKIWLNIDIFLHEGQSVNEWRGKVYSCKAACQTNTGHHACMRARVVCQTNTCIRHSLFRERICGTQCIHQHCQDSCKSSVTLLTLGFCVCVVCVCVSVMSNWTTKALPVCCYKPTTTSSHRDFSSKQCGVWSGTTCHHHAVMKPASQWGC